jgi:DnaJ-class molecular chaperone
MSFLDENRKRCRSCNGTGDFEEEVTCPACRGLGSQLTGGYDGIHSSSLRCMECGGRKYVVERRKCLRCGGTGLEPY